MDGLNNKENKTGQKKSALVTGLVQAAIAGVMVYFIYSALAARLDVSLSAHRVYRDLPAAWQWRCWSDALFIPAVLWLGMGGMMWVATTDFFDIFRYGFSSLLVLFTPFKNPKDHKKYYDYKLEREEKRKGKTVPVTMLVIGVVLVVASLATSFVHEGMVAPWYAEHETVSVPATLEEIYETPEEADDQTDEIAADEMEGEEIYE